MSTTSTSRHDTRAERGRRLARTILLVVVFPIVVGAVIVLVLATTPWGNERVRRIVVSQAGPRLTGKLSIGRLRGNLLSGATLTDVQVVDSLKHPLFTARRVEVRYGLMAALQRRVVIRSLVVDTAVIVLDKQPGARWNFQALVRPGAPKDTSRHGIPPEIADITIRHSRMIYRRPWLPDSTLTADKRDAAIAAAFAATARKRTERVTGGFQRVLDYHDIDARIPVVRLAKGGQPLAVQIGSLSMFAEPYRPPAIDVRSLVGTLYASKDSLWWRGARMSLPGSRVSGDGTIGFHRAGFRLDLTGAPLALADLRWLNPKLPAEGGGKVRYQMRLHGDTAEYAIGDADLRYRDASVVGNAIVLRVKPTGHPAELLVRGADLTVARLSTAIIHELAPNVKLRRSGVVNGHVAVTGVPSDLRVNADVQFDDAVAGRSRLLARGGVGFANGIHARDLVLDLRPLRLATVSGAGVRLPVGGTLTGGATVSGAQRDGWSLRGDITHVEHSERSRVIGTARYQGSGKRIVADATLQPLSLVTVGRFAPKAQLRGNVTGRVHAEGTPRNLAVSGVVKSSSGGTLDGRGSVVLAGKTTRYDIAAVVDALNANAFSRRAPTTRLTGTFRARGVGTSPSSANAVFAADLARSSYDTFSIERLHARGAVANGLLRVDSLAAVERGALVLAKGTFGLVAARTGALEFTAHVDSLASLRRWLGTRDTGYVAAASGRQSTRTANARADSVRRAEAVRIEQLALGLTPGVSLLPDTLASVRRDSLAGSLTAFGVLKGNVKVPGIDARVNGSDLVARGSAVRRLAGTLNSRNVRDRATPLAFTLAAEGVQTGGRAFEQALATGHWQNRRVAADVRIRQDSLVSYAALGSYAHPASGVHVVQLDSLRARFDTLVWRLAHRGGVRVTAGNIDVDSIDLRSSVNGRLFANGNIPKDGGVHLDVAAENVRVSTVLRALQRDAAGDGIAAASAKISGTRADPAITGTATLRNATYKETRAPDVDVDLRYTARRLAVEGAARDSTGHRVLAATASLPLDLSLATVHGSRQIAGALVADVMLDSLALAALPIRSRTLEDLHGLIAGDVHVRGSWKTPAYSGNAALRDAGFRMSLATTGMRVTNGVADLHLRGDTLVLDSLTALARGPFRASGVVDLSDRKHPFVRMSASGRDLRVFDSPRGLVDADASVVAVGPLDSLRVTGRGEMKGGYLALKQFRKDLLRVKAPGDLNFFTVFDTTATPADQLRAATERARTRRGAIIADLSMVIDRGNYYRNRPDANTEFYTGDGEEVRAHLDQRAGDSWAVGFVRIGDGVAFFRTRAFVPARGALTFTPHTNAPGLVQQVGERIVWEPGRGLFPLQLLTGGTSKAPSVGLESGSLFPMRGRELNGYLTLGRLSTSLLQQSGSSLSGSSWSGQLNGESGALARRQQGATALGVVLHDIGTGATKEYGLDAFSVSPGDVPTELVFGKTGGVRGALIEGGRYLTTDRYVAGQLRFTSGIPGVRMAQNFGTQYRLDIGVEPRFLFRRPEELGITHPTVRTGVFGAFLTRMWDF